MMDCYILDENMRACTKEDLHGLHGYQYVVILDSSEWEKERDCFDMGIELEPDTENILNTKAEVNYDSLTGTFQIPDRRNLQESAFCFAFALDEKGIVLIDDSGKAGQVIERFLYDLLEQIVDSDLDMMERYEQELSRIEDNILSSPNQDDLIRVNEIRGDIRELLIHYEQIIDMTQELEENENGFFREENLRYMHLFMNRIMRRHDSAVSLRDHTIQVRDLYNSQLEASQNRTMTLLTVITTIFMPLTLIAGWYGMNFRYMPELEWELGYPFIFVVSILIVVICLIIFRKKKWL